MQAQSDWARLNALTNIGILIVGILGFSLTVLFGAVGAAYVLGGDHRGAVATPSPGSVQSVTPLVGPPQVVYVPVSQQPQNLPQYLPPEARSIIPPSGTVNTITITMPDWTNHQVQAPSVRTVTNPLPDSIVRTTRRCSPRIIREHGRPWITDRPGPDCEIEVLEIRQ